MASARRVHAPLGPVVTGALVAALTLVLCGRTASADTCSTNLPLLVGVDSAARLSFLATTFDREIREVDIWSWTWGSVYAAGAVAQAVIIPTTGDHGVRTGLAVGAISSGGGALLLFGLPLQITLPLRDVRRQWDDGDRCRLLARAEAALASGARDQKLSSGVIPHLGNVLVNVGIGLILGLGYGQWKSAAISAGVGTAIGEANAFTQPHHLPGALERYRDGSFAVPLPVAWSVTPSMTNGGWSVAARVTF